MGIFLSLVLYILVFTLSTLFIYLGRSTKKRTLTTLGIVTIILLGLLRYGIGADYNNYLMSYQFYATGEMFGLGIENHNFNLELFFQIVAKFSYWLLGSPLLFFGIPWALTVLLVYFGIKRILPNIDGKNFALVWLLSITLITPFAFDQMRQTLAIAIFFFSTRYILDKKLFKYVLMIFFASLVHTSAIFIMAISYVLGRWIIKKHNKRQVSRSLKKLYVLITIGVVTVYLLSSMNTDFLSSLGLPYLDELLRLLHDNGSVKIGVDEIVPLLLLIVPLLIMSKRVKVYDDLGKVTRLFLTIGFAIAPLSMFITLGGRLSQYYLLFVPVVIYMILSLRQREKKLYKRPNLLINPYTITALFFMLIIALTGWTRVVPYVSIFDSDRITASEYEIGPFYSVLCDLGLKKDCDVRTNSLQVDPRIWRP